jgi:HEAT repeat protein
MVGGGILGWVGPIAAAWLVIRLGIGLWGIVLSYRADGEDQGQKALRPVSLVSGLVGIAIVQATLVTLWPPAGQEWRGICTPPTVVVGGFLGIAADIFLFFQEQHAGRWLLARKLPHYQDKLGSPDPVDRAAAARAISHMGRHAALAASDLLDAVKDNSAEVRAMAGLALVQSESDDPRLPAVLRPLFRDSDPRVRVAAAAILLRASENTAAEALPVLIDGLMHPDRRFAHIAAHFLGRLGPGAVSAVPALRATLFDRQPPSNYALDALERIGIATVPVLSEAMSHPDEAIRCHAARVLGRMGRSAESAAPALRTALNDRDADVRREAANALKRIEGIIEK